MDALGDAFSGLSLIAVVVIGWRSVRLGARAAHAAEDSARASATAATEAARTADLTTQDARLRRIEAVLDVVLEMREAFNDQMAAHRDSPWVPPRHSPEELERSALCRKLEGRLVPFEHELDARRSVRSLALTYNWGSGALEDAIEELKDLLRSTVAADP